MSPSKSVLPTEPLEVNLLFLDELDGMRVRFPIQDPRYDRNGELDRLAVVESTDSGRCAIAGTGWWGNPGMDSKYTDVEASPELMRELTRQGNGVGTQRSKAKVRHARGRDVALYARGFWVPAFVAALTAVAAIAGAAVGFATGTAPLAYGLLALALVAGSSLAKAAKDISAAASRR